MPPSAVVDWRMRGLTQEEREDIEERAAIIAEGCRIDQDTATTLALEMFRKQKAKEAK